MITRVVMPPLGETMEEGILTKWLKKVGDPVAKHEMIMEIETDKVTVEVESFGAGVMRRILVQEGETVKIGTLLAIIADPTENIDHIKE
jgi:pyruvate dehydrogenase E2 component (dihydrolipoamide acetyltransferase)